MREEIKISLIWGMNAQLVSDSFIFQFADYRNKGLKYAEFHFFLLLKIVASY